MTYVKATRPLSVHFVLIYTATVLNNTQLYNYDTTYADTITNQTMYDDNSWWYDDLLLKPTWAQILDRWPATVLYFQYYPFPQTSIDNIESYLINDIPVLFNAKQDKVNKSFNNNPGRTITTGTGATGFRPSTTRDAEAHYSVSIATSVSLAGNSSGYLVLEIAPTNSATAGDWVEIARVSSGQSGSLVVGLALNQTGGGQIAGIIPAGYYAKIRSVNVAGTPTYTLNGQQEVLL